MAEIFRQKMPISHRAKQFAPFKSLKGFEEALKQKETEFLIKDEPTEGEEKLRIMDAEDVDDDEEVTLPVEVLLLR